MDIRELIEINKKYITDLEELEGLEEIYNSIDLKDLYGKIEYDKYNYLYDSKEVIKESFNILGAKEKHFLKVYKEDYKKYNDLIDKRTDFVTSKMLDSNSYTPDMKAILEDEKNRIDNDIKVIEENIRNDLIGLEGLFKALDERRENKEDLQKYEEAKDKWLKYLNPETPQHERISDDVIYIKGPSITPETENNMKDMMVEEGIGKVIISPKQYTSVVDGKKGLESKPSVSEKAKEIVNATGKKLHVVTEPNIPRQRVKKIIIVNPKMQRIIYEKGPSILQRLKSLLGISNSATMVPSSNEGQLTGDKIKAQMVGKASSEMSKQPGVLETPTNNEKPTGNDIKAQMQEAQREFEELEKIPPRDNKANEEKNSNLSKTSDDHPRVL